jgi:hypothetical protein
MSKFDQTRVGQKDSEPLPDVTLNFPNGACPRCHDVAGQLNVGRGTILYCLAHKLFWTTGYVRMNKSTDSEPTGQRDQWAALGLDAFSETRPWLTGSVFILVGDGLPDIARIKGAQGHRTACWHDV